VKVKLQEPEPSVKVDRQFSPVLASTLTVPVGLIGLVWDKPTVKLTLTASLTAEGLGSGVEIVVFVPAIETV